MTVDRSSLTPVETACARRGDHNGNPSGIGFWALLREDRRTYDHWYDQGLWAIAVHRFGNWRMGVRARWMRVPLSGLYKLLEQCVQRTCGITLPYTVTLGRRVRIWHSGGMLLHAESIGDDVHIRHNTTFGIARRAALHALPTIEDRVDIGCGAVILGRITVGHDSVIGANAVVVHDVPPHSVAVGVPARVVKGLDLTWQASASS